MAVERGSHVKDSTVGEFILWLAMFIAVSCICLYVFLADKSKIVVVPEFTVETASVNPMNVVPITGTGWFKVTGEWKLDLSVKNPSKDHQITYSDMNVAINYFVATPTMIGKYPSYRGWSIYWEGYRISGSKQQRGVDSLTLHALCLNKTRFPTVSDTYNWIFGYLIAPGVRSVGFTVFMSGRMMPNKGKQEVDDWYKEKWQELRVECKLVVDFKGTAAGLVATAATPSSCHTILDRWEYS